MIKKVLKFGGTSVGTIERIQHVANIIKKEQNSGNKLIVVVSAMAGKTNELIKLSNKISEEFSKRELDVLLSSGEQVTCALLSGALLKKDVKAKSWLNWQIPILTEGEHTNARIVNMHVEKINKYLDQDGVAILPGFQGISKNGDVTSIGRGGSDATAVAVAKIFNADSCEIYTDVDGVYSTDPNKMPVAKKIVCNFLIALKVFSSSIITESFISDVEIARILILSSDKALNILYVTPGVETIPAPTIETFETLSL